RVSAFTVVAASMSTLDLQWPSACQQDCSGSFAQNHPFRDFAEGFDRSFRTEKTPPAIRVAKEPVDFFRADDKAIDDRNVLHYLLCHSHCHKPDGPITHQRVSGARNTKNSRKVTCGRVKNRFGKQEWTGCLRTRFNDVAVKTFRVDHAAIRDCEDESRSPGNL